MASVSSGIRRKVDDLGRVVIPAGIRRSLDIREGDAVEVSVDGERVVLAKPRDACVFCGREGDDLERFRARLVCRECIVSIGQVAQRSPDRPTSGQHPPTGPFEPTRPRPADAPPAATDTPQATSTPSATTSAARPSTSPSAPEEPAWPTGPIDGDEFARQLARRSAAAARPAASGASEPDPPDDDAIDGTRPDGRSDRRPPHDPASTTAW